MFLFVRSSITKKDIKMNTETINTRFGTFEVRYKKPRSGRNPKTKETKIISARNVVLFKPSKEFKKFININNDK